jgi:uncharacterized damage-inducible protein DinB
MSDLRYPVGEFKPATGAAEADRRAMIESIAATPARLRAAIEGLSVEQLDAPYRPEGWTVRQVVHHVADSHINSYIRFRLALTENEPVIKPYDEKLWAELADARTADPELSLQLLDALHRRWVLLLESMTPEQFNRTLQHPEAGLLTLEVMLGLYEWHGRHHTAHITQLRRRMRWE